MPQHLKLVLAASVTLGACIVFAGTLVRGALFAPEEELLPTEVAGVADTTPADPSELPDRLLIPALGVDTAVQHVGIARSGKMAVPTNYTDVGWYRYGTVPGRRGSAVIDGHFDNGFGQDAVFKNIHTLKPGDRIDIVNKDGETTSFVVQDVRTYPKEAVPLEALFTRADRPRLNLITCDGDWNAAAESYTQRTVVYAVLAG